MFFKKSCKCFCLAATVSAFSLSVVAHAEERVIEDTLIYKDPTVSSGDQWVSGVSLDAFSFDGTMAGSMISRGSTATYNGTMKIAEQGLGAWVGYGNFSAMLSHRTADANGVITSTSNSGTFLMNVNVKRKTTEINLRWLMRDLANQYLTPYAIVGYTQYDDTSTGNIPSLNYTLDFSNSNTVPLAGLGAIIPINEKIGLRVDGKFGTSTTTYNDGTSPSVSNAVSVFTATAYYNFSGNLNAQVGTKQYKSDGLSGPSYYAMLGYTFR